MLTEKPQSILKKAIRMKKRSIPKSRTVDGVYPLHLASRAGCPSFLDGLVKAGFDINGVDDHNYTALILSVGAGDLEVVDGLLRLGAAIDFPCVSGMTALVAASHLNKTEVARRLVEAGADVNWVTAVGTTALYEAAEVNAVEIVKLLLDAGADVNLPNGTIVSTPLCQAAQSNATDAAKVLVAHGATLDTMIEGMSNALHKAAYMNNTELVQVLVQAGASVDLPDITGSIALHHAARNGNAAMLRYLKAAGSWLHIPDGEGLTVLHLAAGSGSVPAVKEVLSWRVVDVNAEVRGQPALVVAAYYGHLNVVRLLVEEGADVNRRGPGPEIGPMEAAALSGKPDILRFLIKSGGEIADGKLLIGVAQRHLRTMVNVLLKARTWPEHILKSVEEALAGPILEERDL